MRTAIDPLQRSLARFGRHQGGSMTTVFAILALLLLGMTGAAVDFAGLHGLRGDLQAVADSAALAAAREFRLGNAGASTVEQVARNFVNAALAAKGGEVSASVTPTVDAVNRKVSVTIDASKSLTFGAIVGFDQMDVRVSATARVTGGAPVCVVGLDTEATSTILMDKNARLEAPNCAVYSNSTKPNGLSAKNSASMRAAFICSAGGRSGALPGSFSPAPQTDCPIIPDPLAARPQPVVGGCLHTNLVLSGVTTTLMPGTYCGGLTLTSGASVTMSAGTYIFKDGPLKVTGGASLTGASVGLFFSGAGAVAKFDGVSTISLAAQRDGEMAGMLMFEDRASPLGQTHEILSDDARNLLGTIYLPQGRLHVAASKPVADLSAYTIVIARMFTLSEGPTMVLNTNYTSTTVPVPDGVGPNASRTALVN